MKYITKKDISFLDKILFKKGEKIDKKDNYKLETESGDLTIPFSMIEEYLSLEIDNEVPNIKIKILDEDEDEIKKWRVQLDIKTSRKKLIEIENFLRKTLKDYL